MAKLKAHGAEIGTVYFTTSARRYMSDGHVLQNNGFGWKLCHKVKSGESVEAAYAKQVEAQNALLANRPHTVAYRKMLHSLAGLGQRWKLHMAVEAMPDDCDGVWSEACDGYGDNVHADVDEVGDSHHGHGELVRPGVQLLRLPGDERLHRVRQPPDR